MNQPEQVIVYSDPAVYASFPEAVRTADGLIVTFHVQDIEQMRATGKHPHYGAGRTDRFAAQRFGESGWTVTDTFPTPAGPVLDAGRSMIGLEGSGMVRLKRGWDPATTEPTPLSLKAELYMPGQPPEELELSYHDPASVRRTPFSVVRLPDGSLLAAIYGPMASDQWKPTNSVEGPAFEKDWPADLKRNTSYFLKGTPDGRTWTYLSRIANNHTFSLNEPNLAVMDDGRIVCLLRTDWPDHLKSLWPEHVRGNGFARDGYGWFMYQCESTDGGLTWTEPVQLPIWGHPPYVLKLASGNVVMVYGHRRPPFSIRAILSRDGGRTWDLATIRTLREFKPGNYDLGYPVATQLPDGRIFCTYYGYATPDLEVYAPHAIFGTIFTEDWLAEDAAR